MHHESSRFPFILAAVAALGLAAAAGAAEVATSASITSATLGVTASALPKGWFSTANQLDTGKTDLQAAIDLGATDCSDAALVDLSSTVDGAFVGELNPGGQVNAWTWSAEVDLTAYQNHWHQYTACDGTVEVRGCDQAVPVAVELTAYDAAGACRTDDAGACWSALLESELPAVQDPDVVETDCAEGCGIGECVSTCQQDCNAAFPAPGADRRNCKQACVCDCMLLRPAGCPIPGWCAP